MSDVGSHKQDQIRKPSAAKFVYLKVNGQDGSELFFRVRKNAPMDKLIKAYCERQCLEPKLIAFLFDGRPINGKQTPEELEIEDGNEIDAMLHQGGGGGDGDGIDILY